MRRYNSLLPTKRQEILTGQSNLLPGVPCSGQFESFVSLNPSILLQIGRKAVRRDAQEAGCNRSRSVYPTTQRILAK